MTALGTILPTESSLAANDRYAATQDSLNRTFALNHPRLRNARVEIEGGERRYYVRPSLYATVRNQRACYFEIRADGHYSVKESA